MQTAPWPHPASCSQNPSAASLPLHCCEALHACVLYSYGVKSATCAHACLTADSDVLPRAKPCALTAWWGAPHGPWGTHAGLCFVKPIERQQTLDHCP